MSSRRQFLYQRIPAPRPAPKNVLKNVRQVQRDKPSSSGQSCAERDPFKIDLRVQGVPLNPVLEDQGRANMIRNLAHTLRTQSKTESMITDLQKTDVFNTFSEESTRTIQNLRKIELLEFGWSLCHDPMFILCQRVSVLIWGLIFQTAIHFGEN